jgi:hypothetical protein
VKDDLNAAGYLKWAGDPSGRTYLAPDGHRLLSEAEARREIEEKHKAERRDR